MYAMFLTRLTYCTPYRGLLSGRSQWRAIRQRTAIWTAHSPISPLYRNGVQRATVYFRSVAGCTPRQHVAHRYARCDRPAEDPITLERNASEPGRPHAARRRHGDPGPVRKGEEPKPDRKV